MNIDDSLMTPSPAICLDMFLLVIMYVIWISEAVQKKGKVILKGKCLNSEFFLVLIFPSLNQKNPNSSHSVMGKDIPCFYVSHDFFIFSFLIFKSDRLRK